MEKHIIDTKDRHNPDNSNHKFNPDTINEAYSKIRKEKFTVTFKDSILKRGELNLLIKFDDNNWTSTHLTREEALEVVRVMREKLIGDLIPSCKG
jgi:sialic acid synthase SpsE